MTFHLLEPLPSNNSNARARSPATIARSRRSGYAAHIRLVLRPHLIDKFPRWLVVGTDVSVSIGRETDVSLLRIERGGQFSVRPSAGQQPKGRKPLVIILPVFDQKIPAIPLRVDAAVFQDTLQIFLPQHAAPEGAPRKSFALGAPSPQEVMEQRRASLARERGS